MFLLSSFFWSPTLFPRVLPCWQPVLAPSVIDGQTCVFHFGEQGRLNVRHDHSLQVCLASLFACCGASQHERPHVCWPVGCLLLEVCRWSSSTMRSETMSGYICQALCFASSVPRAFDRHFNLSRTVRPGVLGLSLLWCFSVGFQHDFAHFSEQRVSMSGHVLILLRGFLPCVSHYDGIKDVSKALFPALTFKPYSSNGPSSHLNLRPPCLPKCVGVQTRFLPWFLTSLCDSRMCQGPVPP